MQPIVLIAVHAADTVRRLCPSRILIRNDNVLWCSRSRRLTCGPFLQGDDCSARYALGTAYDACPGGCSGRGECVMGFCRCTGGFFGADCSRSKVCPLVMAALQRCLELPENMIQAACCVRLAV